MATDPAPPPFVIGIAGGSGSGKTTLSRLLADALGPCPLVDHDSYYRDQAGRPMAERAAVNYDHPAALDNELLANHLDAFRSRRGFEKPAYDFATHSRRGPGTAIAPGAVAVVEGILVLAHPGVRERLDLMVFVDTPEAERRRRRLDRDVRERGRDPAHVEWQFDAHVQPMHARYVEPSAAHAHLVVSGLASPVANLQRVLDALDPFHPTLEQHGSGVGGRLLTYGTLSPGRENHREVAALDGSWSRVSIRGHRQETGAGPGGRYPGFVPDPLADDAHDLHLLEAEGLPARWTALDAFEGQGYRRRLAAAARTTDGRAVAAWIYVPV